MSQPQASHIRAIFYGLAFVVMWSSAFTSARVIAQNASPLWALSLRFALSGVLAILIAAMIGQKLRFTPAQWRSVIIFGVCQNAVYLGLNFVAMQRIEASLAAVIASSMPLFVAAILGLSGRERISRLGQFGLIIGFLGVGLIMSARITGGTHIPSLLLCLIAVLALSIATLSIKNASSGGNILMVVGAQMLVGSLVLTIAAALTESPYADLSPKLAFAFGYTVLVPGLIATLIWFHLVGMIGATKAASFHFLNPFFGVLIAWALLSEPLGLRDIMGVAIVTLGIIAVQLARQKRSMKA